VNIIRTRKEEHSKKPDEVYSIVQSCSPGSYLELFARQRMEGWTQLGDEVDSYENKRPLCPPYNGTTHPRRNNQSRSRQAIPDSHPTLPHLFLV